MKSTRWSLTALDWLKGFIIAIATPILILLQQLIPSWTPYLTAHWGNSAALIIQAGLSAGVAYILKKLATDDTKQAVKTLEKQNVSIIENAPRT